MRGGRRLSQAAVRCGDHGWGGAAHGVEDDCMGVCGEVVARSVGGVPAGDAGEPAGEHGGGVPRATAAIACGPWYGDDDAAPFASSGFHEVKGWGEQVLGGSAGRCGVAKGCAGPAGLQIASVATGVLGACRRVPTAKGKGRGGKAPTDGTVLWRASREEQRIVKHDLIEQVILLFSTAAVDVVPEP